MRCIEYNGKLQCIEGYWFLKLDKFPHIQIDMGDSMQDLSEYEELMSDFEENHEEVEEQELGAKYVE